MEDRIFLSRVTVIRRTRRPHEGNPMSDYGNPPSDPSGQGQQNPYGGQTYGQPAYGVPQNVAFAHWGKRVGAYLIDYLIGAVAVIPYVVGLVIAAGNSTTDPVTGVVTIEDGSAGTVILTGLVSGVLFLAYFIWNYCLKQGRTGYTIGKGIIGIKLVKIETGQPIGAGMSFVRQLAHFLDSIPCNVGYLWPLWDAQRQTFADKVIGTYVIDQPKG